MNKILEKKLQVSFIIEKAQIKTYILKNYKLCCGNFSNFVCYGPSVEQFRTIKPPA
jgi:hypothetical protein